MKLPHRVQAFVYPGFWLCQVITLGCADPPPSPGRVTASALGPFAVASAVPDSVVAGSATDVTLYGKGFQPGATVSFDGVVADTVVVTASTITTTAPPHAAGKVEVVVTNPGGDSVRLNGGFRYVLFALTSVTPNVGFAGSLLRVTGTGFLAGATVTLGGARATTGGVTSSEITATAPLHGPGAVDVVVTNPGGPTAVLNGGFAYTVVSLTATPSSVTPRSTLSVTWTTTPARATSLADWIGLFQVGASNIDYLDYQYTYGASGTQTWTAPPQAGQYEFRYLPDDAYVDVASSSPITVVGTSGAGNVTMTTSRGAGRTGGPGRGVAAGRQMR